VGSINDHQSLRVRTDGVQGLVLIADSMEPKGARVRVTYTQSSQRFIASQCSALTFAGIAGKGSPEKAIITTRPFSRVSDFTR